MSKYVIIHGQLRELPENELMHWGIKKGEARDDHKYVKREWKNGRWVYTYPEDLKNTNNKTAFSVKDKLKQYAEGVKRDWKESKERGTKKAIEEATKKDGTFIKDKHGFRELAKTNFTDSDDILSGKTSIMTGTTEIREIRRGKLERLSDTAKEYVKDRLGYDEKDAAKAAIEKYEYAKNAEKNYVDEANASINFMGTVNPRDGSIRYTDAQKKEIDSINRTMNQMHDQTAKAEKEASEASKAYLNSPIGKIEKARRTGEEWIDSLFGRKKR